MIDVPVPSSVDVGHATEVLQHVGEEVYGEDRLRKKMLDQPTVMGVERIEVDVFSLRTSQAPAPATSPTPSKSPSVTPTAPFLPAPSASASS